MYTVTFLTRKELDAAEAVNETPRFRQETLHTDAQLRVWPRMAEKLGVVFYVIERDANVVTPAQKTSGSSVNGETHIDGENSRLLLDVLLG